MHIAAKMLTRLRQDARAHAAAVGRATVAELAGVQEGPVGAMVDAVRRALRGGGGGGGSVDHAMTAVAAVETSVRAVWGRLVEVRDADAAAAALNLS